MRVVATVVTDSLLGREVRKLNMRCDLPSNSTELVKSFTSLLRAAMDVASLRPRIERIVDLTYEILSPDGRGGCWFDAVRWRW